ncbi:ParB N-terminal domain-containing protein [Saccharolobus caldissimus]|uniref:ParB-like N-terminal domain-containing protein n=1 Tax=Saccharolobus caldissimus TaxID=1702097 RepID=A0AAQ4CNT9_9CREN|nr:ParB N-terminal domain-containing protein [Saccharolobus caldissimus]BDB97470.1 hypothetical protein SACC_04870 [Saccharolobus caldissimus]
MSKLKGYSVVSIDIIKEVEEFKNFVPENNMYDKIKEDIAKNGIKVPLIVNQNYELINGYTRLKIARELGIKEVPVAIYETEGRADEYDLLVSTNLTQRQLSRAQALALIEKAVEEKMKLLEKSNNSENKTEEQKVEPVPVQLSSSSNRKIQNLTEIRNAVKEELKKHNVRYDDRRLDEYIRIRENASWITDYILSGDLGIDKAYEIYTSLKQRNLLDLPQRIPRSELKQLILTKEGRKILLERDDLLQQILDHKLAVSQAINKIKTEEKLARSKKNSKPRTKEDLDETDEEEEIESIEGDSGESDEYPFVEEWSQARKEEEKEAKQQLTPQLNANISKSQNGYLQELDRLGSFLKIPKEIANQFNEKGFFEIPERSVIAKIGERIYVINEDALRDLEQGRSERWKELTELLSKANLVIPDENGIYTVMWRLMCKCQ